MKSGHRTWLTALEESPLEVDHEASFEKYLLEILGKLVSEDESRIERQSQLRIFCCLDVAVFKDGRTGRFSYTLSEITPCHTTALFWDGSCRQDIFFQEMAKTLHFLASKRKRSHLK
jgi:hypothetical protein